MGADFLGFVLLGIILLLSYQMPIYVARLIDQEAVLSSARRAADLDGNASYVLFWVAYMLVGFALWVMPLMIAYKLLYALRTPRGRLVLLAPVMPLQHWASRKLELRQEEKSEQRRLRELYEEIGRDEFPSFRSFVEYFNFVSESGYVNPATPYVLSLDDYRNALDLLGLEDDGLTERDLTERHRRLMKQVHADVAGPSGVPRRLNEARELIRAKKGWKK